MELGSGAFEILLGHVGESLMNETSDLIKQARELLCPFYYL
jgi:hypothetical protein